MLKVTISSINISNNILCNFHLEPDIMEKYQYN